MKHLSIAILAPLKRPITPDTTVSRNRVIVDLALGLLQKGHKVTIFGTSDSQLPGAKIVGVVEKGLNFLPAAENDFYRHTAYLTELLETVAKSQTNFDLVHNHMYPEYFGLLLTHWMRAPLITTVHSQMVPETVAALKLFPAAHLIAISESARKLAGITSLRVIHNSIDINTFTPDPNRSRDYLLFVGRMSKAKDEQGNFLDPKGVQHAIVVAEKMGERLKIVGNVEDPKFYEILIKPHLSDKIEFVGEVSKEQKLTREQMVGLYQGAKAFLNPINWEEPFGLVMAEALACGTPVVAFDRGAVSEIVTNGKVGYVVDPTKGIDGLVSALHHIDQIDRSECRRHAVANFSTDRMVEEYEKAYFELLQ